jgi:transcriptional regulator with XRE-family HTH domain
MRLKDWRKKVGVSMRKLGTDLDVTHATASRWCDGSIIPSREAMSRIVTYTKGEVGPSDFYDLPDGFVATPVRQGVSIRVSFTGPFVEAMTTAA